MSAQERFNHFMNNPEEAFNMWQDLVEKLIFDNADEGLLDMEEGVVYEIEDEVKSEEAKAEQEAEHLEEMLMAAGMYH